MGAARMPTQGSWRPLVMTSALWPWMSMDSRGLMMELVGLMAMLTSMSCPVLIPPKHAPRVVVAKAPWSKRITVRGATLRHAVKTGANLHALDGVEAHHGVGNIGIKLVEQRLTQAHGHAGGLHADAGAARVTRLAQASM